MKMPSCLVAALAMGTVVALRAAAAPPAAAGGRFEVQVQYHKLSNGLKVVLSPDATAPVVVVAVYYNIGFRLEPKGRTGFAHLFEHMMYQGSRNLGKMEFIRLIQANGGILNGSTRFDFTNYYQVLPAHTLETVLWAEADRMRGLAIDAENLKNQQEVVKNEVKVNVLNQPYGGFPWLDLPQYANVNWANAHNFYGDLAELDAATLEDVKDFFRTYYAPNNAALVVSGDHDPAQALAWVRRYFGDIPAGPAPRQADVSEPRQEKERRSSKPDALATRPALAIGYHAPPRLTPEYYAMGLIDQVLLQGRDSRLWQALVDRGGFTGEVGGGLNADLGNMFNVAGPTLWSASLLHDADKSPDAILAAVDTEIEALRSRPVDHATLGRALVKVRSDLYRSLETLFGFGKADLLASFALFDDDPALVDRVEAEFRKVTPELLQRTAREYLRPTNRTVLTVEPRPAAAAVAPAPANPAPAGQAAASKEPAPAPQEPAQEAPPPPGRPKDFRVPPSTTTTLPNGLRVTLVPYGAVPMATVRLVVDAGNVYESSAQVWLADLTGRMLEQGTTTRRALEVAEEAARMGGSVEIEVEADRVTIGGDVLGEFAADMLRLVADVARNPRFPESELPRLKADLKRELSVARAQAQPLARERFREALYGDHPYGRMFPTPGQLDGYTLHQVRGFHQAHFGAGRAQVFVAGVFDAASVEAAAREAFGGWARGAEARPPRAAPRSARALHLVDRPAAVQSTLVVGLPVIDPSHADWVPLVVTHTLLGGYFSSRITANLREDKGYTYSPFSQLSTRRRDAHWNEEADVTTAVTGPALKEIFAEIDRLQAEPPSEEELERVKNYLAGTFVLRNSSRSGIIGQLNFVDLHALPADYLTSFVSRVHAVTPQTVQEMARKHLQDDAMTIVVVGDRRVVEEQLKPFGTIQ